MIISASRRTDIPAFYSEWFINRLKEGDLLVPNPRNPNRLGRVRLSPDIVDCIAFWTKNPAAMLPRLSELDAMGYTYYIQFTLTPYGKDMEPHLPSKATLMDTFIKMSGRIGPQRSVWRYDPVVVDTQHSTAWHMEQFAGMCGRLGAHTRRCVLSFVDTYPNLKNKFRTPTNAEVMEIAAGFSEIAQDHGIALYTCAEEYDLARYGIGHGACVDRELIEELIGSPIAVKKDANQRSACRCMESIDVGVYDTCSHGCTYCYATSGSGTVMGRMASHDPRSPMLTGFPAGDERITERTMRSQKIDQISFFER